MIDDREELERVRHDFKSALFIIGALIKMNGGEVTIPKHFFAEISPKEELISREDFEKNAIILKIQNRNQGGI